VGVLLISQRSDRIDRRGMPRGALPEDRHPAVFG